jgi:hypothetical protein
MWLSTSAGKLEPIHASCMASQSSKLDVPLLVLTEVRDVVCEWSTTGKWKLAVVSTLEIPVSENDDERREETWWFTCEKLTQAVSSSDVTRGKIPGKVREASAPWWLPWHREHRSLTKTCYLKSLLEHAVSFVVIWRSPPAWLAYTHLSLTKKVGTIN